MYSERKIDSIARDIGGIKLALQNFNLSTKVPGQSEGDTRLRPTRDAVQEDSRGSCVVSEVSSTPSWDHSIHILDFVKAVVERGVSEPTIESNQTISSLKSLVYHLENPDPAHTSSARSEPPDSPAAYHMPPLDAVVSILRWAKCATEPNRIRAQSSYADIPPAHKDYLRIAWICQILPLQAYEDICRKVCFAIDDYTDVEFIVANGFLSYVFAEHALSTGAQSSREHCQLSRMCLSGALLRLPYVLPASAEVISSLVFGVINPTYMYVSYWHLILTPELGIELCRELQFHQGLGIHLRSHESLPYLGVSSYPSR